MKISQMFTKESKPHDTTSIALASASSSSFQQEKRESTIIKPQLPQATIRQIQASTSYPTSTFKFNSIVGAGIKLASINTPNVTTTTTATAKPLVIKSFILPPNQHPQPKQIVTTVVKQPNPNDNFKTNSNNQTSTTIHLNKLPNATNENVKTVPPIVNTISIGSQSAQMSTAPTVLKMKSQTINKIMPQMLSISSMPTVCVASSSLRNLENNRNTIRCLLDPSTENSRKINERVMPTPNNNMIMSNMSCLKILQPKPTTMSFTNLSYDKTPQLFDNNKTPINLIPTNSNKTAVVDVDLNLAYDTNMGPHETFVFDLGLSLVQNYERPNENAIAKEFVVKLKHSCPTCDFKCDTELIMDTHLTEPHESYRSNALKCFYCESVFRLRDEYRKHMNAEHNRICLLEKPFNKNACGFCDYELAGSRNGRIREKLKDHIDIDCPFSKMRFNASKRNLLQNLQAPSYIDCLNSAYLFNRSSVGEMCVDKYGDFKFYFSFRNLDATRMNLLNNIKLMESILGIKTNKTASSLKNASTLTAPSTSNSSKKMGVEKEPEIWEPVAKKMKLSAPSQIMCDLCQVMFVDDDNNTGKLLKLLRDHLFKFHMIRNISQLDNIVERAYLKLLGVNGTITVGVPPPFFPTSSSTQVSPPVFLEKSVDHNRKVLSSSTDLVLEEKEEINYEDNDSLSDIVHIEKPDDQRKPRGLTIEQKYEIMKYHTDKPHLRQTELIYHFEKKFKIQIPKSTISDLLNGKGVRRIFELKEKQQQKEKSRLGNDKNMVEKNEDLNLKEIRKTKLEEQLLKWLNGHHDKNGQNMNAYPLKKVPIRTNTGNISNEAIIAKAKEFGEYLGIPSQILSSYNNEWLENFKKRFNLITGNSQSELNKNENAKVEPQAEIGPKKVLDENVCEMLPLTAPKKDQNILINSAIDDSTEHSEKLTEEQTVEIVKIVESVTNSMREKSKNVIYDQLLSRAFSDNLKSISFSTRIFFNLAQKIEEDIFKKTKFNHSLDYELSIESTCQKIGSGLSNGEFLKIFREKCSSKSSEFHTKFISLTKRANLIEQPTKNEVKCEEKVYRIKCDFCKWELVGTNILYQRHLISNHLKQPEVKLRKIDEKLMKDLEKSPPVKLYNCSLIE